MTSPTEVARFHAEFDRHTDDRVRLFAALQDVVPSSATVLYPGSYVDIAPSVWFDDVTYVDTDKRAARFFAEHEQVEELIEQKRSSAGSRSGGPLSIVFEHRDYREPLEVADSSVDLLVSLYAGFITEHCLRYVRPGGLVLVNNSHGDASMASLDPACTLVGVVLSRDGKYRFSSDGLDRYLVPKRGEPPTVDSLHESGRGIAYTRPAFAYMFERV